MENKFCINCGAELSAEHAFCTNCGTPVSKPDENITSDHQPQDNTQQQVDYPPQVAYPPSENTTYTPEYSLHPADYPPPTQDYSTYTPAEYPPPPADYPPQKKPASKGFILSIIAVAVVALLLGVFLYLYFQPFAPDDVDEPPVIDVTHDDAEDNGSNADETEQAEDEEVQIEIVQIDNTDFPVISFYANIKDKNNTVISSLTRELFELFEVDETGSLVEVEIEELRQVLMTDDVSINLVMDKSGSMSDYNRMTQAQNAAAYFLNYLEGYTNSFVELTFFDDFIYVPHTFTNDFALLTGDIYGQSPGGSTALYDAIYAALLKTNEQSGAKCVIVFTDGEENASSSTFDDVVKLAQATGIPVYIVGVGFEVDEAALIKLANLAGGSYFSSLNDDLEEALKKVYTDIYNMRREMYIVRYKSIFNDELEALRKMVFRTKTGKGYSGETEREYIPVPDIHQGFSDAYWDKDFILDFSSNRVVSDADLSGLSLAELRIARNEIFARHGRMFVDPMLNKWFYSKQWYLSISRKYSPDQFNALRPYPLSRIETENVNKILDLENRIMQYDRIFPNSSSARLTEYDVSLRKEILQRGLDEIYTSAGVQAGNKNALNDVERFNVELIEHALAQPDIQY